MKMELVITAKVYEGESVLGEQEITLNLPDTDDNQSALNCLAEGQINFSKIAEQVGIAAVWIAARELNKRIEADDDRLHNLPPEEGNTVGIPSVPPEPIG